MVVVVIGVRWIWMMLQRNGCVLDAGRLTEAEDDVVVIRYNTIFNTVVHDHTYN